MASWSWSMLLEKLLPYCRFQSLKRRPFTLKRDNGTFGPLNNPLGGVWNDPRISLWNCPFSGAQVGYNTKPWYRLMLHSAPTLYFGLIKLKDTKTEFYLVSDSFCSEGWFGSAKTTTLFVGTTTDSLTRWGLSKRWLTSPERWGSHAKITRWNDIRIFCGLLKSKVLDFQASVFSSEFNGWLTKLRKRNKFPERESCSNSKKERFPYMELVIRKMSDKRYGHTQCGWWREKGRMGDDCPTWKVPLFSFCTTLHGSIWTWIKCLNMTIIDISASRFRRSRNRRTRF